MIFFIVFPHFASVQIQKGHSLPEPGGKIRSFLNFCFIISKVNGKMDGILLTSPPASGKIEAVRRRR